MSVVACNRFRVIRQTVSFVIGPDWKTRRVARLEDFSFLTCRNVPLHQTCAWHRPHHVGLRLTALPCRIALGTFWVPPSRSLATLAFLVFPPCNFSPAVKMLLSVHSPVQHRSKSPIVLCALIRIWCYWLHDIPWITNATTGDPGSFRLTVRWEPALFKKVFLWAPAIVSKKCGMVPPVHSIPLKCGYEVLLIFPTIAGMAG